MSECLQACCYLVPEIGRGTHDLEGLSTTQWPKALYVNCSLTRREVSRGGNIVLLILTSAEVFLYLAQVYSIRAIICPELLALFHRFFELTTSYV